MRRSLLALTLVSLRCNAMQAQDVAPVVHVANPPSLEVQQAKHYVVLVSLDGFRYDYVRMYGAPNLDAMARNGASTPEGMFPSYPSVTFPNHYTLVTGLRPEHHGITAMQFYDPDRKESYSYSNSAESSDGTWYYGTPLWVLAEQQGMRSACFFWPGSEAKIDGVQPSFYLHFDDKLDDALRVDQIAAWLKLPAPERPHLLTLYYSNVDHAGHSFGPEAAETLDAVHHVDVLIGKLRAVLHATGLPIDLIVTADHGMVKVQGEPVVLDQYADLTHFKVQGTQLYPETEVDAQKAVAAFRAHPDPRFSVYRRLEVPKRLSYDASPREGDPVVVANGPYGIYPHAPTRTLNIGSHGFDPHAMPEMKAIFYAEGPDVKAGVKLRSFNNVDVYPFVAKLLGLQAPPTDGNPQSLEPALR